MSVRPIIHLNCKYKCKSLIYNTEKSWINIYQDNKLKQLSDIKAIEHIGETWKKKSVIKNFSKETNIFMEENDSLVIRTENLAMKYPYQR